MISDEQEENEIDGGREGLMVTQGSKAKLWPICAPRRSRMNERTFLMNERFE